MGCLLGFFSQPVTSPEFLGEKKPKIEIAFICCPRGLVMIFLASGLIESPKPSKDKQQDLPGSANNWPASVPASRGRDGELGHQYWANPVPLETGWSFCLNPGSASRSQLRDLGLLTGHRACRG